MAKIKAYSGFDRDNNTFYPNEQPASNMKLTPGAYTIHVNNMTGKIYIQGFDFKHDQLLDLPTKEYQQIVNQIEHFLKPETRAKFDAHGFLYKRSALLHGSWGTGKTCIVSRIANYATTKGGITLFNPDPRILLEVLNMIEDVQPEATVVVVWEELDKMIDKFEQELLNILDGEVQKSNIIFLATTNYIDKIPARVKRPGRFSNIVEVAFPDAKSREFYLKVKIKDSSVNIAEWVDKTEGFSIDELKATVLDVMCLDVSLDEVITTIKAAKDANVPTNIEDVDYEQESLIQQMITDKKQAINLSAMKLRR